MLHSIRSIHNFKYFKFNLESQRFFKHKAMQSLKYISSKEALQIDEELTSTEGFSFDQLMELAGLSVACSVADAFPLQSNTNILVVCGPGNNGGDGLVAARHLTHFGYKLHIVYPKPTDKPIFKGLVTQCKSLDIPIEQELPKGFENKFQVVLDAIFGFSFKGPIRKPFGDIIKSLNSSKIKISSVDVPSGWNVDEGPSQEGENINATQLISLTAPKLCSLKFDGDYHYLGGRFVPLKMDKKYNLNLPVYEQTSQFVV